MMFSRYLRGMVYWAKLPNMDENASVTKGIRPVIIVSNNVGNCTSKNIIVVPCTTNTDKNLNQPTHTIIRLQKDTPSLVLCEDILTIPKTALSGFMGMLDTKTINEIDNCLMAAIGLIDIPNPFTDNIQNDTCECEEHTTDVDTETDDIEDKVILRKYTKRLSSTKDITDFIKYYEMYGVERTLNKYNISSKHALENRLWRYRARLGGTK